MVNSQTAVSLHEKLNMNSISKIIILLVFATIIACQNKQKIEILEFQNEATNKYEFVFTDSINQAYYKNLANHVNLDSIIRETRTPTEVAVKLTDYTHDLWNHNGDNTPSKYEGITIINEAKTGEKFRCVEYSIVLTELLNAANIPARIIGLKTKDVETRKSGAGHVAVEYYDNTFKKWIYADAQANVIAFVEDEPLNCVELQKAIKDNEALKINNYKQKEIKKFSNWIGQYLYYFDSNFDQRVKSQERLSYKGNTQLMLIPTDANKPKLFQVKGLIENTIYTNSIGEFYPIMEHGD